MHFIIMGCGRVGSNLALTLRNLGHSVAVIDSNPKSLSTLPADSGIEKVVGFGFDSDTLKRAGAINAFSFAAVTDNDNTNVLAARVAKEEFKIEKVVARVYNANRSEIFERLGVPTVATLKWTENQILRKMIPIGSTEQFLDSNGLVGVFEIDYDESWIGKSVSEIENYILGKIAFIQRLGDTFLPQKNDKLQVFDSLFILANANDDENNSHILGRRFDLAKKVDK